MIRAMVRVCVSVSSRVSVTVRCVAAGDCLHRYRGHILCRRVRVRVKLRVGVRGKVGVRFSFRV